VPTEAPYERLEDLAGASVATVYPRLTLELLPVEVELVDVTGSVEVAPRLGLAEAIVDLVSSGNTLRTNGLRSLGTLFTSEAVLVAPPAAGVEQLALVPAKEVWRLLPQLEAVGGFSILVVPVERMLR
jgi:ATP phosphoribosyltransferase